MIWDTRISVISPVTRSVRHPAVPRRLETKKFQSVPRNVDHADGSLTSHSPHTSVMWSAQSSLSSCVNRSLWHTLSGDLIRTRFRRTFATRSCSMLFADLRSFRIFDAKTSLVFSRTDANYHPFMMSSDVSSCGVFVIFSTAHLWNYLTETSSIRSAIHCWINVWRAVSNTSPNFPLIWNISECALINDALWDQLSVHQRILRCPLSEESRSHQ